MAIVNAHLRLSGSLQGGSEAFPCNVQAVECGGGGTAKLGFVSRASSKITITKVFRPKGWLGCTVVEVLGVTSADDIRKACFLTPNVLHKTDLTTMCHFLVVFFSRTTCSMSY